MIQMGINVEVKILGISLERILKYTYYTRYRLIVFALDLLSLASIAEFLCVLTVSCSEVLVCCLEMNAAFHTWAQDFHTCTCIFLGFQHLIIESPVVTAR